MASPITWRTVTGPSNAAANALLSKSIEGVGGAFNGVADAVTGYADDRSQRDTDAFLTELNAQPDEESRQNLIQQANTAFLDLGKVNAANRVAQTDERATQAFDLDQLAKTQSIENSILSNERADNTVLANAAQRVIQNRQADDRIGIAKDTFDLAKAEGIKDQNRRSKQDTRVQQEQEIVNQQRELSRFTQPIEDVVSADTLNSTGDITRLRNQMVNALSKDPRFNKVPRQALLANVDQSLANNPAVARKITSLQSQTTQQVAANQSAKEDALLTQKADEQLVREAGPNVVAAATANFMLRNKDNSVTGDRKTVSNTFDGTWKRISSSLDKKVLHYPLRVILL